MEDNEQAVQIFSPAIPEESQYPVSALVAVRTFSGDKEYEKVFGGDPSIFDETFGDGITIDGKTLTVENGGWSKNWKVKVPDGERLFSTTVITQDGQGRPREVRMVMTAAQAATYNMPGQHKFQPFRLEQSTTVYLGTDFVWNRLSEGYLLYKEDVDALVAEMNRDCPSVNAEVVPVAAPSPEFPVPVQAVAWGDARRVYRIKFSDGMFTDAWGSYANRHAAGFDAPGSFKLSPINGHPVWKSDLVEKCVGMLPVPTRPLLPNESLIGGLIIAPMVVRKTLPPPTDTERITALETRVAALEAAK